MFTNVHHTLRIELIVLCMINYHSVKRILVDNISCRLNVKTIVLMQFIKASGFLLAEILIIENYRLFDGGDVIYHTWTIAILLWLPLVENSVWSLRLRWVGTLISLSITSHLLFKMIEKVKLLPFPTSDSSWICPPNSLTIFSDINSPRPIPFVFLYSVSYRKPKSLKSFC